MPSLTPLLRRLPVEATTAALARAKARLDRLSLYPQPVRIERVRVVVSPFFFRLPGLRRYRGYALRRTIVLRDPFHGAASDDLLTHELCHIWQMQHRPVAAMAAWLRYGYDDNPFELEARRAVRETRA
jgi:hypothetical protein